MLFAQFIMLQIFFILWICLHIFKRSRENDCIFTQDSTDDLPEISVIIPAKNEEGVIAQTIENVLRSDYKNMSVYVVNDGSTDGTAEAVSPYRDRVNVITNEVCSGHKAFAVNKALEQIDSPLVVILDSDAVVKPDSFTKMLKRYDSEDVGCVSAIVSVENNTNVLTLYQKVDYIIAMFLRTVQDKINAVPTSIGVCSMIRTDVLKGMGGMPGDTLIEDGDFCAMLKKEGYYCRISDAVVGTIVPENPMEFFKQRKRWMQGRIQVSIKHKDLIMNPKHGLFGMLTFPYEAAVVFMALLMIPALVAFPAYFLSANDLMIVPLLKKFFVFISEHSHSFIYDTSQLALKFKKYWGFFISPLIFLIMSSYLFFALVNVRMRQNILYYLTLYLSLPYVLFLLIVNLSAAVSELRNAFLSRKSSWGTRQ